jgi:hypothetical protein
MAACPWLVDCFLLFAGDLNVFQRLERHFSLVFTLALLNRLDAR